MLSSYPRGGVLLANGQGHSLALRAGGIVVEVGCLTGALGSDSPHSCEWPPTILPFCVYVRGALPKQFSIYSPEMFIYFI